MYNLTKHNKIDTIKKKQFYSHDSSELAKNKHLTTATAAEQWQRQNN